MTPVNPQNKTPQRVLIVEDEADMCLLLEILLTGKNLELDHVKSLRAAGEYLQQTPPQVIILDNKLKDGFGMDYIPYLKKNYPDTKIIMISGYDLSAKDVALDNGADIFLEKPFTREQLYDAIKTLLKDKVPGKN